MVGEIGAKVIFIKVTEEGGVDYGCPVFGKLTEPYVIGEGMVKPHSGKEGVTQEDGVILMVVG